MIWRGPGPWQTDRQGGAGFEEEFIGVYAEGQEEQDHHITIVAKMSERVRYETWSTSQHVL